MPTIANFDGDSEIPEMHFNAAIALLQTLQQRFPDDGRIHQTLAEFQAR